MTKTAQHQNRNPQISTSKQKIGTTNYKSNSRLQQGINAKDCHENSGEPREITNIPQRKSSRTKPRNKAETQSESSISDEIAELRPSATIGKSKRRGLLPNWEKLFERNKETIRHTPDRKDKSYIQPKLHYNLEANKAIGENILDPPKADDIETIWFHNINGMKDERNWEQIIVTMKENNVNIFGLVEINKSMDNFSKHRWQSIIKKHFYYSRTIHSESTTRTETDYKPGGTLTTITGKWQARVVEMGRDPRGLGRWSHIKISSKKSKLVIITAYRPCKAFGPSTVWMQQWSLLRAQGMKNPDPIKTFYEDLTQEMEKWTSEGAEIILMIDANEPLSERPGGLGNLIGRHELIDLSSKILQNNETVTTYARGSKKIDFIFGTRRVEKFCEGSGIVPFGFGYPSDHRALFVRINIGKILNANVSVVESRHARKLNNATPKDRLKFLGKVFAHYQQQNIFVRLQKLRLIDPEDWSLEMQREFEKCDEQHINGMLAAEKQIAKRNRQAWSPRFGAAISKKAFWKIALSLKMTHRRPSDEYITWAEAIGIDDFKALDIHTIKRRLRESQRELREIEKQADNLREEHLRELISRAEENETDQSFQKRLKEIKRAHARQSQFQKIRSVLKPNASGGLSYILVPKDFKPDQYPYDPEEIKEWEPVHEQDQLQEFIQKRNIIHFGQAHGTPFTHHPLDKLDWSAESLEATEVLRGAIPVSILSNNTHANKIIQYIANREQLPEIDTYITPEQVSQGFKKWRETTSTSPSGCHLGLRRIPAFSTDSKEDEKIRQQIQQVQADIINIPIGIGFSPTRWQVVVNAMLEKIEGKPFLHKLRVIHILEADYNLALKEIFGRRLMKNCEIYGTLGDHQDGFRKGRSTMRTLLQNELLNDYNKRLRINNFVGMTDISGCFDRIIPSIVSLLNRKNGCPSAAVKAHAKTLQSARYYLKTKHGVSDGCYTHSNETPIYGNGQGAGDSPSQWSQESALLFDLYAEAASCARMSYRNGIQAATIPLTAFADDTNLMGNDDRRTLSISQLADQTKQAFELWNTLLHATGHFMELSKCACYFSIWDFQEDGYAYMIPPDELDVEIKVKDVTGVTQTIKQLPTDASQKLLGVMKNPIGNQQDEVKRLKTKSDQIAAKMNSQLFTHADALLAYEAFYIPAMRYSLAITSINQMDFERVQGPATTAFLAAMGYNRHMPRAVVQAPKIYQGLGLRHLYDVQGCDSTRLLIQEINTKQSLTGRMLRAALDTMQLESGIGQPILEDTRALDYVEWGWVPQIRDFLQHIDGKIVGATRRPPTYRKNDQYIMDDPSLRSLTFKERMLIHRCRIYLQVETLSDISDAPGGKVLTAWLDPHAKKPSFSLTSWPKQSDPGKEAWKIWKKFITGAFTHENGKLRQPLGKWTHRNKTRVHDGYYDETTTRLFTRSDEKNWKVHKMRCAGRRCLMFDKEPNQIVCELPFGAFPIDITMQTDNNIVTSKWGDVKLEKMDDELCGSMHDYITMTAAARAERITLLLEEKEISQILKNPTRIEVASDGGFDPTSGISSYGWVIAFNRVLIAKGRGPAEAHPDLGESFRSEGYGLASVSAFITALITFLKISVDDHIWKFYIDNKAMIQRMESYNNRVPHSRSNLRPDADITNRAHVYLRHIPASLEHVKSHQDEATENKNLPFSANLNIIADALATQQRECMAKPVTKVTGDHCHLVIQDRYITRDSQKWIMQKAGEIPIQHYYWEKYGWKRDVFEAVYWDAQHKALQTYQQNDQRRILKFVHDWLPTNHRLYREGQEASSMCPLCGNLEETNEHLLTCPTVGQQQIRDQMSAYMRRDNENHGNSELNNIIELALTESITNRNWTPVMSAVSRELVPCIQQQNKIGWQHLFRGRIAKKMADFMESHYRSMPIDRKRYTGVRWCKMLIKNIWNTVLRLWENRNEWIHGKQLQAERRTEQQRVHHRVCKYYEMRDLLEHGDREKIFYKDLDDMLNEDARYLKAWLKLAQRVFSMARKEQAKTRDERKMMDTYFNWRPAKTTQRNAKEQRAPDDTHPD
jgi:hypothetical protein